MPRQTGIAVIESRWWQDRNTSVRGLFDLVADISCGNPHRYHYEMAGSKSAMKEAIPRIGDTESIRYLCIATHGDIDGIFLHNDERFSRTELRNCLNKLSKNLTSRLFGLHMSSCIFGSQEIADFIFEHRIPLTWLSGYKEKVDWIDSSAMDLIFFNHLVKHKIKSASSKNKSKQTASHNIRSTARHLLELAPGLIKQLGFGIYVRGRRGGAVNLLAPAYD